VKVETDAVLVVFFLKVCRDGAGVTYLPHWSESHKSLACLHYVS